MSRYWLILSIFGSALLIFDIVSFVFYGHSVVTLVSALVQVFLIGIAGTQLRKRS